MLITLTAAQVVSVTTYRIESVSLSVAGQVVTIAYSQRDAAGNLVGSDSVTATFVQLETAITAAAGHFFLALEGLLKNLLGLQGTIG